jgi:hypothetical protein
MADERVPSLARHAFAEMGNYPATAQLLLLLAGDVAGEGADAGYVRSAGGVQNAPVLLGPGFGSFLDVNIEADQPGWLIITAAVQGVSTGGASNATIAIFVDGVIGPQQLLTSSGVTDDNTVAIPIRLPVPVPFGGGMHTISLEGKSNAGAIAVTQGTLTVIFARS